MKLLERLIEIQTSKELSDREFARLISVSNTTWSDIKKGDVPIGYQVLKGAIRELASEYPALRDEVISYLGADPHRSDEKSHTTQVAAAQ